MTARRPLTRVDGKIRQLPAGDTIEGVNYPFTWDQATPLAVWTVPHNLGKYPSVTVVDDSGQRVQADVRYVDENIIQITHGAAYTGKAYIN